MCCDGSKRGELEALAKSRRSWVNSVFGLQTPEVIENFFLPLVSAIRCLHALMISTGTLAKESETLSTILFR